MVLGQAIERNDEIDEIGLLNLSEAINCAIGNDLNKNSLPGTRINKVGKIGQKKHFTATKGDSLKLDILSISGNKFENICIFKPARRFGGVAHFAVQVARLERRDIQV